MDKHRNVRLKTGAESDVVSESSGGGMDFFKDGVICYSPTAKARQCAVRVLPAFDSSLSPNDSAYPTSVAPYRDRSGRDSETATEAFSNFYVQVRGYPYFGNNKLGILSPATLKFLAPGEFTTQECADPIMDCRNKARNSGNPVWEALVGRDDNKGAVLPYQPVLVFVNGIWNVDNKGWTQGVYMMKDTAFKEYKKSLSWPSLHNAAPMDPNWPAYLFGDVTDPKTGLLGKAYKTKVGTVDTYCLHYSTKEFSAQGAERMPIGEAELLKRVDFSDFGVFKWLTYQEIVDIMLADGCVPRDLVEAACGHMANVPPGPGIRHGHDEEEDQIPMNHPAQPAYATQPYQPTPVAQTQPYQPAPVAQTQSYQTAPAPVTPYPTTATTAAPSLSSYWVAANGNILKMTTDELQTYVETTGNLAVKVMAGNKEGGWLTAAQFGFSLPVEEAPPELPPEMPPELPPEAPDAPPSFSVDAPSGSSTLTPAEAAEFNELVQISMSEMDTAKLLRFMHLKGKQGK